ncbi:hypothetical protein [Streptomyces sp. NPDC052701]|uniref:hypothetical protein n=1 Tax=Streptomyces sp. NPDC052701 TaxID=3155533 RepID=UPI003415212D
MNRMLPLGKAVLLAGRHPWFHGAVLVRRRGIRCTVPGRADQPRDRENRGARGGRPPKSDPHDHRARHAVECGVNRSPLLFRPGCEYLRPPVHHHVRSGLLDQPQRGVEAEAVRVEPLLGPVVRLDAVSPGTGGPRGPDSGTERGVGLLLRGGAAGYFGSRSNRALDQK